MQGFKKGMLFCCGNLLRLTFPYIAFDLLSKLQLYARKHVFSTRWGVVLRLAIKALEIRKRSNEVLKMVHLT